MNKDEGDKRSRDNPWQHPNKEKEGKMSLWGILGFGLIGAAVTTFAVKRLRSTIGWIYSEMSRSQSSGKNGRSFRFRSFQEEEEWKRYLRMQAECIAEMEREERIRRMQSVRNREKNKFRKRHDSWQEYGPGAYHQHFQMNDWWYWKEEASFRDQGSYYRETPKTSASSPLSHHYSVLGLNRLRTKPYTDDEIKSAFRAKAKEFHPDQNQNNKEFAEAKFKEVMASYEAIKSERKNNRRCL